MKNHRRSPHCRPRRHQQGFSVLEAFVGIMIGLFVLAGVLTVLTGPRQIPAALIATGSLQADDREALLRLSTLIEHAGYFHNPQARPRTEAFPANKQFAEAGQVVTGNSGQGSAGDTISVRYVLAAPSTSSPGFMENCQGPIADPPRSGPSVNTFTLNAKHELTCAVDSQVASPLLAGLSGFNVLYGVDADGNGSVNAYLPASAMTSGSWQAVVSVQLQLRFINPLDARQPIPFVRIIKLMGNA